MLIAFIIVIGLVVVALAALLLLGRARDRIASGRLARMARMGRLSARLSTSWFGTRVRRLFAGKARRARLDEAQRQAAAVAVTKTMGEMKGAVMKLGQMMSFVSDSVPPEMRAALQSLQAAAPPMDFALLRDVAERELGMPLERAFARFDEKPIAAASIGQVHRAQLPTGEEVVVKIQYPGVDEAIRNDLKNVAFLYRAMALFYPALDPGPVIAELRDRVLEELDYANEARSQRAFHARYDGHPFIRVPRVYTSHSTSRVLTSEFVRGRTFSDVLASDAATRNRFGEILYRFVFSSIIRHAAFNADPHPGNYLYDDEGRIVVLDYGCVKYFPEVMFKNWIELVKAHLEGDRAGFRARAIAAGFVKEDTPITTDTLYDYFGYFYEPFRADRVFEFTPAYNGESLAMVFKPSGRFEGLTKRTNMPGDYTLVNRLTWGVTSILAQLGATANWHRIHREMLYDDPPSTPLGEADAAFRGGTGTMSAA